MRTQRRKLSILIAQQEDYERERMVRLLAKGPFRSIPPVTAGRHWKY